MSKTLKTIQIFSKVGKILSKIIFIFCIVGAAGCLVGIIAMGITGKTSVTINGVTIHGIIEASSETSIGTIYAACTVGFTLCLAEVFLSKIAEIYFRNELEQGNPFTFEGSKELMRLGIYTICIPIGALIACQIEYAIFNHYFDNIADMHLDDFQSVGLGVMFIALSVICRYGAELRQVSLSKGQD